MLFSWITLPDISFDNVQRISFISKLFVNDFMPIIKFKNYEMSKSSLSSTFDLKVGH